MSDTETEDVAATAGETQEVEQESVEQTTVDDLQQEAEPAPETTEQPADEWRQAYEELGFQGVETPEEAQQRAIEALRQRTDALREAQEQIAYMRSLHARLDRGNESQAVASAAEPQADPDPFDKASQGWGDVDVNQIAQYITQDENGNRAWRDDTPPEIREQWSQQERRRIEWAQVISDPRRLSSAIDSRVNRMLADRLDGVLSERDTQMMDRQAENEFFSQHGSWIYERDPVTNGIAVDLHGNPKLSLDGQRFASALKNVRDAGVARVQDQLNLAYNTFQAMKMNTQSAPLQQRQQAQAAIQQNRRSMLGRTNPSAGKASQQTVVAGVSDGLGSEPTGGKRMSATRRAMMELKEEGYQL